MTVENNTIHSCARFACYKIGDGSTVTIRNDTIDVPNGHGTQMVLNSGRNDDWTGAGNTVVFEDNVITGSGVGNPLDESTYPSQIFPVGLEAIITPFAEDPIARTGASGC